MELIDSHCHIDFSELSENTGRVLENMRQAQVVEAVCVSVRMEDFPRIRALAERYEPVWATVGVHPDSESCIEPTEDMLIAHASHPKVIAIGETGLDYYRLEGDLGWQKERFRTHIRAAVRAEKPLVVHTRQSAHDTISILRDEGADAVGGIMHCFTESLEIAKKALDLGFYISFSGILSFKSADDLRFVAKSLPLDRILIETDSPYLAPVPFRGKTNEPAYVRYVAQALADLRGLSLDEIAEITTANFRRLFPKTNVREGLMRH